MTDGSDVLIIGSGFGGSVAALRLAEKGYRVTVLEAGRRFEDSDLASAPWQLHRILWAPRLGLRGIVRVRFRRQLVTLTGIGVGGGSLAYAGAHYRPEPETFDTPGWDASVDWATELAPSYSRAERMLGTTTPPRLSGGDRVLRRTADTLGVGATFHPVRLGIHFGQPGEPDDASLSGHDPGRRPCTLCGQCTIGCAVGAKNTLSKNYLLLAERAGARIHPLTTAIALRPRPDGGWYVHTVRTGALPGTGKQIRTAAQVVLAAGAWGTPELLHRSRAALPKLSPALGTRTCTNGELIYTARAKTFDVGAGGAITSGFRPDTTAMVQLCRAGSGRHPVTGGRRAERSAFLNTLTRDDHVLTSYYNLGRMTFHPTRIPTDSAVRSAVETFAQHIGATWGVVTRLPVTAHLMGGCPLGTNPATSVADCHHRVHGYPTLHVADASTIPHNLGVNPALTITAMAERAFATWPAIQSAGSHP